MILQSHYISVHMYMQLSAGHRVIATEGYGEKLEWLVTNGIGGYACGTVSGMRTRVYHGLLVAAENPPVGRLMVVPGLDERAMYRGQSYELSAIRWSDGTVAPAGHRNATSFRLDGTVPVWRYQLGDAVIERRLWMVHGQNETRVTYSVLWAAEPVILSLKVFAAHRDHHAPSRGCPDLSIRCDGGRLHLDNLTVEAADGPEPGPEPGGPRPGPSLRRGKQSIRSTTALTWQPNRTAAFRIRRISSRLQRRASLSPPNNT